MTDRATYFDGSVEWPDEERHAEALGEPAPRLYDENDGRAPAEWATLTQRIHATNERRTPEEWEAIRQRMNTNNTPGQCKTPVPQTEKEA